MLLANYQSYIECQKWVNQAYQDRDRWTRMSILNVAQIGKFSADRAVREYCEEIWQVEPLRIKLEDNSEVSWMVGLCWKNKSPICDLEYL